MKQYRRIYMIVIFGILTLMGFFTIFGTKQVFSENENRYLEQFPEISISSIWNGEFQTAFEEAFSDQFPLRNMWLYETALVKKGLGFCEQDGVYLADDGYYPTKTTMEDIDQKNYLQNLRYVEYLGDFQKDKTSLVLAPSPGTILQEKLPVAAPYYDDEAMYETAGTVLKRTVLIDPREEILEYAKQNQVYYKTDHHWTLLGAYAAYSVYSDVNGLESHTYGYFVPKKISESFYGTMYSKVMAPGTEADTIYAATNIPQAKMTCDGEEKSSIYDVEKLTQKDKYAYFFGGNYGKIDIEMNNDTSKKLLVVKDSYANCFVPFLLEGYNKITMLDLRYYKKSVRELLEKENYDRILILYEMSNFAQDSNLYKLAY